MMQKNNFFSCGCQFVCCDKGLKRSVMIARMKRFLFHPGYCVTVNSPRLHQVDQKIHSSRGASTKTSNRH